MEKLTLDNICDGLVPEVFARSLKQILANIRDPNTDPEAKRTLTLEFVFRPHSNRAGADVVLAIKERLASLPGIKGGLYLSSKGGELAAYPRDPRQEVLFDDEPPTRQ